MNAMFYSCAFPPRRRPSPIALGVEKLEDRLLLDCAAISGFVYHDQNLNGIRDPGEAPLAATVVQLRDASGQTVATTTTNDAGFYLFDADPNADTTPAILQHDITFDERATGGSVQADVPQFDPELGTLTSIEIHVEDKLTSVIKIENLENAAATVFSNVTGTTGLGGPSLDILPTELVLNQSFVATAFDGVIDFGGTSGKDYGPQVAGNSQTKVLTTAEELAPYIGTGTVTISERTQSSASASALANIVLQVNTTISGRVRVVYNYIPNSCLSAGDYAIVLPTEPAGFIPGLKTSGNITPIPGSALVNFINVTLHDTDLTENNFGELKPSRLSGYVYHDANSNAVRELGEHAIAGASINLTGVNDLGQPVNLFQGTATDGAYVFADLRPGIYTITEAQPPGFWDGKESLGTQGGALGNDALTNIQIGDGVDGQNNNFGEVLPATLSGTVYVDRDLNGTRSDTDTGIASVAITLRGIDDLGNPVSHTQQSGPNGSFAFANLRPGTYAIFETQPAGYRDGLDTVGSLGGVAGNDELREISTPSGAQGAEYNFGEALPGSGVAPDPRPQPPRAPLFGKQFFLASRARRG
jgi:hypothetical protein